jgi:hypothetical protein
MIINIDSLMNVDMNGVIGILIWCRIDFVAGLALDSCWQSQHTIHHVSIGQTKMAVENATFHFRSYSSPTHLCQVRRACMLNNIDSLIIQQLNPAIGIWSWDVIELTGPSRGLLTLGSCYVLCVVENGSCHHFFNLPAHTWANWGHDGWSSISIA